MAQATAIALCGNLAPLQSLAAETLPHDAALCSCTMHHRPLLLQAPSNAKVIDAAGKYVMPGGIDPHTHLSMPFMGQVACDDFYR